MTDGSRYVVAGHDVGPFLKVWFDDLKAGKGEMYGLLDDGPEYATMFLTANIAPHAVHQEAPDEVVLLSAVLVLAQRDLTDKGEGVLLYNYEDMWQFIQNAFAFVQELGDEESANRLVRLGIRRAKGPSQGIKEIQEVFGWHKSAAETAAHEQEMARITQRELRAAKLFKPDVDIDAAIMSLMLDEDQ